MNKFIRTAAIALYALIPPAVYAQVDSASEEYQKGHAVGKVFGYIIVGVVIFMVLKKIFKK